jgi:hypothetical protein
MTDKNQKAPMHAWPKRGEATSCCGRLSDELPLADGRTSDPNGVTCDGTFTPAVWAHDVYPHPSDRYDDEPPLADAAKYHAARALALTCSDIDAPGYHDRLVLMLAERSTAWHVAALARGMSGQEALRWVHNHDKDDSQELLYDLCHELGVELHRIKPYALRERS